MPLFSACDFLKHLFIVSNCIICQRNQFRATNKEYLYVICHENFLFFFFLFYLSYIQNRTLCILNWVFVSPYSPLQVSWVLKVTAHENSHWTSVTAEGYRPSTCREVLHEGSLWGHCGCVFTKEIKDKGVNFFGFTLPLWGLVLGHSCSTLSSFRLLLSLKVWSEIRRVVELGKFRDFKGVLLWHHCDHS